VIPLKQRLRNNQPVLGSWLSLGHMTAAEIMCDAGFDWLAIDLEHTPITLREAENLIRVIALKGCVPLVRLTTNDVNQIKRVMDSGAHGIIVPSVASRAAAEQAVRSVRYPPAGVRGVGLGRAHRFGPGFEEYFRTNNESAIVVVQIESREGIEHLDDILGVEGIDATMIGPYDLSASLGVPGQFDHPEVIAQLTIYEQLSRKKGVPSGAHVIAPDHRQVAEKIARGYRFVAMSADYLILAETSRREMASLREAMESASGGGNSR
jgi:2-keto-3-deoxy-L-rhamnonate aldolase RhmA